jgi:glycosyltransferase involved in cell wall biosynthesis
MSKRPTFHLMASNEDAKRGIRPYVAADKFDAIDVAYSGFDSGEIGAVTGDVDATRAKFSIDADTSLIVTTGQFIERKGCWTVLEALIKLKSAGIKFTFLWLGTSTSTALSDRINGYALGSSFRLLTPDETGPSRHDLLKLVAAADIFVLASSQEGLPISLVEAMALGRACIATPVGAIPEALEQERNGILVPPNDPETLATAIRALLSDPAKMERLGRAAAATARAKFEASQSAAKVIKLYDSLWQT